MRPHMKLMSLQFDSRQLYDFFYQCLSFSNHCLYNFHSDYKPASTKSTNYIKFCSRLSCVDNHINTFVHMNGRISSKPCQGPRHQKSSKPHENNGNFLAVYILRDINGSDTVLFGCKYSNTHIVDILDSTELPTERSSAALHTRFDDDVIYVEIQMGESAFTRSLCLADLKSLEAAQLIGINIPLILVQNFMGRKIITKKMIDLEHIDFERKRILLPKRTLIFDLDETLIWDGFPIKPTQTLVETSRKHHWKTVLLTRRFEDLDGTLEKIQISRSDFSEVIQVSKNERKSSFIRERAIFIDNEFPERYDVRVNTASLVLNLDSLDYCCFDNW